jgi:hypothetical protein
VFVRKLLPLILLGLLAGCSARDPVTQTPVYHIGTPTNRSSVNSWELNSEPINTQPGLYHGKAAHLQPIASQRGFEPDDPVAEAVWNALTQGGVSTQYLSAQAKNGVVILTGSVTNLKQKARAEQIARAVPGVKHLDSRVMVIAP